MNKGFWHLTVNSAHAAQRYGGARWNEMLFVALESDSYAACIALGFLCWDAHEELR
jgi:hypothetical protein